MKFSRSLNEIKLQKGGGGGGGGGSGPSKSRQKLKRTSTNTVDKSTWNRPPKETVLFFQSKRIQGIVEGSGNVVWFLDGSDLAKSGAKIPTQELKDLKRAWKEYIKSPNSKKLMYAFAYNSDGRGASRKKQYEALGFTEKLVPGVGRPLAFDNR